VSGPEADILVGQRFLPLRKHCSGSFSAGKTCNNVRASPGQRRAGLVRSQPGGSASWFAKKAELRAWSSPPFGRNAQILVDCQWRPIGPSRKLPTHGNISIRPRQTQPLSGPRKPRKQSRAVSMNPVDHPAHGGAKGKTSGAVIPVYRVGFLQARGVSSPPRRLTDAATKAYG